MDELQLQVSKHIQDFIQEWDVENKQAIKEERYPDFGKFMGSVAELYDKNQKSFMAARLRLGLTKLPKKGMFGGN